VIPLRALPRIFLPGATTEDAIALPREEIDKLRKVLRLNAGAEIAVLPDDGSLIRCTFDLKVAIPTEQVWPNSEPPFQVTLAQALPKGDKLDEIVRACTELGVSRFVIFPSERSVVKWDADKLESRTQRLRTIAREAAEVSFRTRVPVVETADSLAEVLAEPTAEVLSEAQSATRVLARAARDRYLVVGPEGGWSEREFAQIGDRGVTLGPRVLRVDHAGPAAAAILLLSHE
jgi:16S rRNA (uracil1498-N3)-methyltransferase